MNNDHMKDHSEAAIMTPSQGSAIFSPCGSYRYELWRHLNNGAGTLCVIALNPSKATAEISDPTVTRLTVRSEMWGFKSLCVLNLFAWRSTDPRELMNAPNPVGIDNDNHISLQASKAAIVLCGWGNASPLIKARAPKVLKMLRDAGVKLHYLKMGATGQPWHPLYIRYSTQPVEWLV